MQYEQAYSILRWHVGFDDSPAMSGKKSFFDNIRAIEKDQSDIDLDESVDEIIDCLESVNVYINGPIPSDSIDKPQQQLSRILVGTLSDIVMLCLDTLMVVEQQKGITAPSSVILRKALWRIECAWSAVLDGDIDHIREHVELVENAREWNW